MLERATQDDFSILIDLWEQSVCATHDFLPEHEIIKLKPLILNEYFHHVVLHKYIQNNQIIGFIGTSQDNIEMLFIHPNFRGQGVGKVLTHFALETLNIQKVDVNEQNTQAVGFYKNLGFKLTSRSALDGQGQPYPILHLQFNTNA